MKGDAAAFLLSAACGAALLLIWDIFHGLRRVFFKGVFMNTILDAAWWACAAILPVLCLWNTNSMRFRFFELFGAALGGILYYLTISSAVRSIFCVIFGLFLKLFKIFFKILLTPAGFLYKILIAVFVRPIKLIFARTRKQK